MNLSRPLLLGLIAVLTLTLGWVSYDELRRREASIKEFLQTREMQPLTISSATTEALETSPKTLEEVTQAVKTVPPSSDTIPVITAPAPSPILVSNKNPQTTPTNSSGSDMTYAPEIQATQTTEEVPVCSSFDLAGLLATFDASLAAFIANASVTYGDQYTNLQYQLSSKTGTIAGELGTVTTTYSGTVQELSTGEPVSANGIITANFAWDGCSWQLVDYSF